MERQHTSAGYILMLTLMIIGLMTTMGTYLFVKGQLHVSYMQTMIQREKAQSLALSGIAIAQSQITQFPEKKAETQKPLTEDEQVKQKLERFLPVLNRWQTFRLTEEADGVAGSISLCLMCENGKININQIYDFDKHTFIGAGKPQGDMKKVVQTLCERLQELTGSKGLFSALEAFLKQRTHRLDDVTELLMIPAFSIFKKRIFYEPPSKTQEARIQSARPVYLADIFTTWSESSLVVPWLFSDSLSAVLGLTRAASGDTEQRARLVKNVVKNAKKKTNWSTSWNTNVQPLYGKDFTSLPKSIHSIFNPTFEPAVFSVLVHATVKGVTQRVYAIIRRARKTEGEATYYTGNIKRVYWL